MIIDELNELIAKKRTFFEKNIVTLKQKLAKLDKEYLSTKEKFEQNIIETHKELFQEIIEIGKEVEFAEVLEEITKTYFQGDNNIDFINNSKYVMDVRTTYKSGQPFNFNLFEGKYIAELSKKELLFKTNNLKVRSFKGKKVEEFYTNLVDLVVGDNPESLF